MMSTTLRSGLFAALLALPVTASAGPDDFEIQDEDDDIVFDDEEPAPDDRPDREDDLTVEEDEGELEDFTDQPVDSEATPGADLLGDDPSGNVNLGAHNETIYRQSFDRLSRRTPDEELLGWEQYLATYPNSVFRPRIEGRMKELEAALYAAPSAGRVAQGAGAADAQDQQIDFAHAMQLNQLNPRSRLQVGFEWGLTDYMLSLIHI